MLPSIRTKNFSAPPKILTILLHMMLIFNFCLWRRLMNHINKWRNKTILVPHNTLKSSFFVLEGVYVPGFLTQNHWSVVCDIAFKHWHYTVMILRVRNKFCNVKHGRFVFRTCDMFFGLLSYLSKMNGVIFAKVSIRKLSASEAFSRTSAKCRTKVKFLKNAGDSHQVRIHKKKIEDHLNKYYLAFRESVLEIMYLTLKKQPSLLTFQFWNTAQTLPSFSWTV